MTQPEVERRSTRRFQLSLPVTVKNPENGDILAHTRDISSRGICFYAAKPMPVNSSIEFTLTLTPEITLTESIHVRCHARVLRIEDGTVPAVAALIDHYDFLAN
jgi:hypothetical protein